MTNSIYRSEYIQFRQILIESRQTAELTQTELAQLLGKPQSFVSKYESGERRLDLIEFLAVAEALQFNVYEFIKKLEEAALK